MVNLISIERPKEDESDFIEVNFVSISPVEVDHCSIGGQYNVFSYEDRSIR